MRVQTDWLRLFEQHAQMVWFVVRYSNGAVHPFEVMKWPLSQLRKAQKHISFWMKTENKNSKAT